MPFKNHELGTLADPKEFCKSLDIQGEDTKLLISELGMMLLIRRAEELIGDMILAGKIVCPCHLAIGQEAIPTGIARHLRTSDRIFGTHRSHGHFLSVGNTVHKLFAEILGKVTGCSKGMGGSMHLYGEGTAFRGSVPIVAGTISMAVGAALAAKLDKKPEMDIAISYFGDGAIEEGSVHESLNFAALHKLPKLFVCENNLFSSHLHIRERQPKDLVARFAMAHNMNYKVVDGNDIVAVARASDELIQSCRSGEGAGFLEVVTYRWRGHVGPHEDNDVGLKRSEELYAWKLRDPVRRLHESLVTTGQWSDEKLTDLKNQINTEVTAAWEKAENDPYPPAEQLFKAVYNKEEVLWQ